MPRSIGIQINGSSLVVLLFLSWSKISSANILYDIPKNNPLNIDWYPAPSPEDGPPLSAGALRNKAYLPAEIGGILGAYILSVIVVGIAIIVLGRRLRMSVQKAAKALDIEMVEPKALKNIDTNYPRSPGVHSPRNFSWPSPEKDAKNPYVFPSNGDSPITPPGTTPYVDTRVVEADQEMMQRDLEDLYAHVMEQEDAKQNGVIIKEMPPPAPLQKPAPAPAEAPQRQPSPTKKGEKARPSQLTFDEAKPKSHSRTSSIISSIRSPKRKGIRSMRISSPILTPKSNAFAHGNASDEEPLTPRYYATGPPPPIPTDQVPYQSHSRNVSLNDSPTSPTRSIASQLEPYSTSSHHRPNPSQTSMVSQHQAQENDPISAISATSQTMLFSEPPSKFASQNVYLQQTNPTTSSTSLGKAPSAQNSTRALPLRQFESHLPLSPRTPTGRSFMSSSSTSKQPAVKTTVLERTTPVGGNGPQTAGLRTPWSAGAVPYSPYQPFTPMMPITPRLVTKEERKLRKKMMPKTPVIEMVEDEKNLWDSGY